MKLRMKQNRVSPVSSTLAQVTIALEVASSTQTLYERVSSAQARQLMKKYSFPLKNDPARVLSHRPRRAPRA